ncbi:CRISPR-associated protein Cas4 [Prevotella sp.]|uniref:CRISPR-associated protein Cas4 n=1 Tax=Prevotella sp. TaxID=59823 RepID=UPI003DA592D0
MQITGTLFNYFQVCKRKLWLFANNVNFEQTSDLVYDGKLIHEDSYPLRSSKYEEIEIDGIKVDYYDTKNKVIHEIKKSNKIEQAHEWQLKYYMYVFEQHGVTDVKGILEYPTLRKTQPVVLSDVDRDRIKEIIVDIDKIISSEDCPPLQKKGICKSCSYYEFCFTKEVEE